MAKPTFAQDIVEAFRRATAERLTLTAITAAVGRIRQERGESVGAFLEPAVRCQLQRRCSTCKHYSGIEDLFRNPSPGVWQLR